MSGTPKTMKEAVQNGYSGNREYTFTEEEAEVAKIETAVRDFLAQKFTTHLVLAGELKEPDALEALKRLWNDLFPEKEIGK